LTASSFILAFHCPNNKMSSAFDILAYFINQSQLHKIALGEAECYSEELEKYGIYSKKYGRMRINCDLFGSYCDELSNLEGTIKKLEGLKKSGLVAQTVTNYKVCNEKMSKKRMRETGKVVASIITLDPAKIDEQIQDIKYCLGTMEIIKKLTLLNQEIEKDLQGLRRKGDLL